jgi:two-component system, chemotaxis family, CheB/CheR fusion protein
MPKSSAPEDKAKAIKLGKRNRPALDNAAFKVVAIGASAGGLEASTKLVEVLPTSSGMAFILVQHLDPTHPSMMVELLSSHTKMKVAQVIQGMEIEGDHIYVIPPGTYLSVKQQTLQLSKPLAPHGARLPFDFLLKSMADELGSNAICVVLSGTGADGSIGLKSLHEKGGLVIAQDPDEAGYDGMPRSAIATGFVDHVLPVTHIPEALTKVPAPKNDDTLRDIVELLRKKTKQDFTLYKLGTLQRRVERRMALAAIAMGQMESYFKLLQTHPKGIDLLAKDLLIHVTNFFRDPKVFDFLADKIIPEIIGGQTEDKTVRVWIAGCSTGEEAYSLAILFREHISAAKSNIKLQIFASDLDADAVSFAREGSYSETIKDDISPARLERFFSKDENGYRVSAELRSAVIFTVQDVLSDPPFSRLDLVSCRNLLIYLGPEAQAKVILMFHFALRQNGILLLGNAETISKPEGRFETISKVERVYRHIGRSRPGELNFLTNANDGLRVVAKSGSVPAATRQTTLAELCRRLVMESFAPAAVLINAKYECIYTLGPTDRYLSVAQGHSTLDVLAMARHSLRSKLKLAILDATKKNTRVVSPGGRLKHNGKMVAFSIDARPIRSDGEDLMLICFLDEPSSNRKEDSVSTPSNTSHVAELESELENTKTELKDAIRNLEVANEDQRAINEEASSVNEEYQSTNEELLTSKEELQSLNEELNALNTQLHETLDRQRSTSDDLQNILYSTNVATLFLDMDLKIRFFTPATKSIFNVIPTDVGRPLADLNSLSADTALATDAHSVLKTSTAIDREIETQSGMWFIRRILPYKTSDDQTDGVVITFTNITERKAARKSLEDATLKAELANIAKSRFLAAASHDLRQPLQTLALLQGLLAKNVEGDKPKNLVSRLDQTLVAMTGMLNSLLDINQIEAGTVKATKTDFQLADILTRLHDEFSYQAQSQKLKFHLASCHVMVHSDAKLLEQMLRNLITNALKYTKEGKVLLGCRRHKTSLTIEVWDTGVGIPEKEVQTIFEEFYQLDNAAHERSRGLGLGLSIVKRLGFSWNTELR